ncbi:hypothetical protein, partial [Mycobacterium avium]
MTVRRGFGRAPAGLCVAAALVLSGGACATHKQQPAAAPATLRAAPDQLGPCAPDRLARCVPGLADVDENLFGGVAAYQPDPGFASVPPSAAREAAPEECQHLPRFGAQAGRELDVEYQPARDTNGRPLSNRFPANGGDYVRLRFTVAGDGDDIGTAMAAWARRCPMWAVAQSMNDSGIQGWLVAESGEHLSRYQSGDVASQWPYVSNTAAVVLPNKVIVQAWYTTNDPSAASRNQLLSQLIGASGHPRPRSALPPKLADWSQAQISTLLPAIAMEVGIDTASGDKRPSADEPGGQFWALCTSNDHAAVPRYDPLASWQDFDQSKWDQKGKPPHPTVVISRAHVGDDFLTDLRREIASCTAHLTEKSTMCGDRENRQLLQADSAVAEGVDTVRLTHRWMRDVDVRGHSVCGEGVEAIRVAQVRGLIVISSASKGGWLFKGETPAPDFYHC